MCVSRKVRIFYQYPNGRAAARRQRRQRLHTTPHISIVGFLIVAALVAIVMCERLQSVMGHIIGLDGFAIIIMFFMSVNCDPLSTMVDFVVYFVRN